MIHVFYSFFEKPTSYFDWSHHKSFEDDQMNEAKLEVKYLKEQGFQADLEQTRFNY